MRPASACLLVALTVVVSSAATAQAPTAPSARPKPAQLPADSMAIGRKLSLWLYANRADSILAHMDSASRAQPNVAKSIEDGAAQLALNAGTEQKVLDEKFITRNGNRQYWRTAQFSSLSEPFLLRIVMNANWEMTGVGMGLASQAPPIDP